MVSDHATTSPEMEMINNVVVEKNTTEKDDKDYDKELLKKIKEVLTEHYFVRVRDFGSLVDHYTRKLLPATVEK